MIKQFSRSSLAVAIAMVAQQGAIAAEEAIQLEPVVVSATGFEQKLTDAPASISVITQEELKSRPFTTLLDAVRYQEGVDIGATNDKTGRGSISMRGLGSEYTLILIDGKRMNNHGDIYPNSFGGNQFTHIPPMEAIERIEVIRGPASTLYGADAMGGVINIITKKHPDEWSGAVTLGHTFQTDDVYGDDRTAEVSLMGPLIPNKLSLGLRGALYDREASTPEFQPFTDPAGVVRSRSLGFGGGGKTVDSTSEQYGVTLTFQITENQSLRLDYDTSEQEYDNTPVRDPITGELTYPLGTKDNIESIWRANSGVVEPRAGYREDQVFTRDWWSVTHEGNWRFGTSTVALSHVETANEGRTLPFTVAERQQLQEMWDGTGPYAGLTTDERRALAEATFLPRPARALESSQYTLDARVEIPINDAFGDHMLVIGGQVIDGELKDGVFGMESGQPGGVQDHKMYSLFVEDNWMPTSDLTLTAGVRHDDHDMFGSQVSPRLYAVYTLSPEWTVKGGVATGYKTPQTTDLYDGITGFGGQGVSPFVGNPDLKPETSVNTEIALYWKDPAAGHNFNITYFKTDFEDKIANGDAVQSCEVTGGVRPCVNLGSYGDLGYLSYSQKINIDEVEIQGVEVAGRYQITPAWSFRANYTWTDSEQKSGPAKGQPLNKTAEHMANATLDWQATDSFNVFLQAELSIDRFNQWDTANNRPIHYRDYEVYNLGARLQLTDNITVNALVANLLDEDFTTYKTIFNDLNGDGDYADRNEITHYDDYLVKDKARSYWLGLNVSF